MIVDQIDIIRIAILESKHYAPVGPYDNTPEPLQFSSERMQSKAGETHVFRSLGPVQNSENVFNLRNVIGANTSGCAIFK